MSATPACSISGCSGQVFVPFERIRLTAGTLYGALSRLEAERLVEQDREEIVNGRYRRYYRLTASGLRSPQEEAAHLAASAQVVQKHLSLIPPSSIQEAES